VDWSKGPPSPFTDFERRIFENEFGKKYDAIFDCPQHGQFACEADGTAKFLNEEIWVSGPNGEKLFRM